MKMVILTGAALAALVSAGGVQAQSCSANCTTQHSTCARAGKDYGSCMGAWRQCKAACLAPVRGVSTAKPVLTVARR